MVSSLCIFEELELFLLFDVLAFRGILYIFICELIAAIVKKMMPMKEKIYNQFVSDL